MLFDVLTVDTIRLSALARRVKFRAELLPFATRMTPAERVWQCSASVQ
jgi:hypothetical protein